MKSNVCCFAPAEILLPDSRVTDISRWAVVACDQYTSEPAYWESAADVVGNAPSTLSMILPEVYLETADARIPSIHAAMEDAMKETLVAHPDAMILLKKGILRIFGEETILFFPETKLRCLRFKICSTAGKESGRAEYQDCRVSIGELTLYQKA